MPKNSTSTATSPAGKVVQREATTARIKDILYEIRDAANLPRNRKKPSLPPGNYCTKFEIFTRQSDNVNDVDHAHFTQLGSLFCKVSSI